MDHFGRRNVALAVSCPGIIGGIVACTTKEINSSARM
jgi:hypothetical protein